MRFRYTTTATARLADCCLIRGVYGGRTAAGDASRASGEVRSDPRRGRAVVKQNDKQTASRDDRAHRFGPPAQQVVAPTSCDVRCASLSRPPGRYLVGNSGERRETRPQLRPGRRPLHPEARSVSRRGRELSVNSVRGCVPECMGRRTPSSRSWSLSSRYAEEGRPVVKRRGVRANGSPFPPRRALRISRTRRLLTVCTGCTTHA